MRLMSILALIIVSMGMLAVGCGGEEAGPTAIPTHATTPTSTSTLTHTPSATPAATHAPTPTAVSEAGSSRYIGDGSGADWPSAMAVDEAGNVYVTGKSYSGNNICGEYNYDYSYATVKYDVKGNQVWAARYDGPGGDNDVAQAIAVDASGNVYVTGRSYNGCHYDFAYATLKYSGDGTQLWAARYDSAGEEDDMAQAIALDSAGNVYVTGSSGGDYATIKYDNNGKQLWAARYSGPAGSDDEAVSMGVDGAGNVYVTGNSQDEIVTVKYDTSGNQLWVARYEGQVRDMAVDGAGYVYVTGQSKRLYVTIKYDPAGTQLWACGCSGPLCGEGEATAIALDNSGNVYITGDSSVFSSSSCTFATVKCDSEGKQLWIARYIGCQLYGHGGAVDIAVDNKSGSVYVAGSMWGSNAWDYITVGYNSKGREMWAIPYDGPATGYDEAAAIAVDGQGNVYVTGKSDGGRSLADYLTIKYVPIG